MGLYRYEAVDRGGKVVRGAMNAGDEQQVAHKLSLMGYSARAVYPASGRRPASQSATAPQSAPGRTPRTGVPVSVKSGVGPNALAAFFRHMATLVRSGMPVNQALHEMAAVTRDRRLAGALVRLQETTGAGQSLSSVMAQLPGVFPVHTTASVWAGELAGRLEIALEEAAVDLEQEASDVRIGRIGWGLTKLNLIAFVIAVPAANVAGLLTPVLEASLAPGGEALTREQVLLLVLNTFARDMLWKSLIVAVALIALWIAWGAAKRVPSVKRVLDGFLIHVPMWGSLHRERALARFLHVLDGLYSAGVSPAAAWDAASLTPRNSYIAQRLRLARQGLPSTAKLSDVLAVAGVFPPESIAMAASGEKAGSIPDVLANMSADYADRAAARKNTCRMASVSMLITSSLILGGYIMIRMASSYFELAFRAADMMGH